MAQAARLVSGALAYHAPPVRPVGRGRGDDRCSPGRTRRARRGRADRLVEGEHRRHARTGGQKGNLSGPSPVDRGKPGSKIHAISDRGGLPLYVDVSAANLNDHLMLKDMVEGLAPVRQPVGRPGKRPLKLHGDKGYDYPICRDLLRARNITARIARKGIESSTRLGQHRYVIERCLEWITRFRRLVRRYEKLDSHFLGFLRLACAVICYRRAVRLNLLTSNNPN